MSELFLLCVRHTLGQRVPWCRQTRCCSSGSGPKLHTGRWRPPLAARRGEQWPWPPHGGASGHRARGRDTTKMTALEFEVDHELRLRGLPVGWRVLPTSSCVSPPPITGSLDTGTFIVALTGTADV